MQLSYSSIGIWEEPFARAAREDLTPSVRALGKRFVGHVTAAEAAAARSGATTLAHGDASMPNMRTYSDEEIVLLDWEDVSAGPGICDLAWMLVSSVDPGHWDEAIAAYGRSDRLAEVLPAALSCLARARSDEPQRCLAVARGEVGHYAQASVLAGSARFAAETSQVDSASSVLVIRSV